MSAPETLDHAFDPIFAFDPGGRVLWGNRAARELFAGAGAGLEGEPIQRFVRLGFPADGEPGTLGTVIRSEAIRADGAAIPVEISLGRTGDGKSRLYTAVVRDIGERVETEERITLSTQRLEVANRRLKVVP